MNSVKTSSFSKPPCHMNLETLFLGKELGSIIIQAFDESSQQVCQADKIVGFLRFSLKYPERRELRDSCNC